MIINKIAIGLAIVYFFASSFVFLLVQLLIALCTFPFDERRRLAHYFASWWGNQYITINPFWQCKYEGKENIDSRKTYVLVANHQSFFDIFALYGLYKPFKWVSKDEIYKLPFVGQNMDLNQYVHIKRGDIKSIKEMMQTCKYWLLKGISILMFPEGTRSEDGELIPFRDGSFRLACECNVPIVPIVINGTHGIYPKSGARMNFKAKIIVKVLPPVDPKDFNNKSAAMRDYVRDLMKKTLADMREQASKT